MMSKPTDRRELGVTKTASVRGFAAWAARGALALGLLAGAPGCSESSDDTKNRDAKNDDASSEVGASGEVDASSDGDAKASTDGARSRTPALDTHLPAGTPWQPGVVLWQPDRTNPRGYRDVRGIIHAHSPYSHDACDDKGFDEDGNLNATCLQDFRRDTCAVRHDFVMITDHPAHMAEHPFEDVLLHDAQGGDTLLERDGRAVANRMACDDGHAVLLTAGFEDEVMAVGLDGHIAEATETRGAVYTADSDDALGAMHDGGALVLVNHPEDWTVEQLRRPGLDGFEMYNLHANLMERIPQAAQMLAEWFGADPSTLPHPDLAILPLLFEDERYLRRWAGATAGGLPRTTVMGTDCHRNTLPMKLSDDERVDSYRRMMVWFSNHLLLDPAASSGASWDDRALEQALAAGRLYGVFEVYGYAEGFDASATHGDETFEIGSSVPAGATVRAVAPRVAHRSADSEAPLVTLRLLHATDVGWVEAARSETGTLEHTLDGPGAWRVQVDITPRHLRAHLGTYTDVAGEARPWVYANPFYVQP